jgi:hypothetical protein
MRRVLAFIAVVFAANTSYADDAKAVAAKAREVAGTAEFLRHIPKHFATLQSVDAVSRRVTLLIEGDKVAKTWELVPDAELKVAGWWARLEHFTAGDRVWVWFQTDRKKQPVSVLMMADEPSQLDIHDVPWTIAAAKPGEVTLKPAKGAERIVKLKSPTMLATGTRVWYQTAGDAIRLLHDSNEFEARRSAQKQAMRQLWEKAGLPGTISFLHPLSGELELMLDHEAMRWARALKPGDEVSLMTQPPARAAVREVKPWRERTQLRLVVAFNDQLDLRAAQRVHVKVPVPAISVQESKFPPDLGRRQEKAERIEWFLASIYCTCLVRGNICTGHFYTLASCNPNGCGQPNLVRKQLAKMIDDGLTDVQIFEALLKEHGPGLLKPHLLP